MRWWRYIKVIKSTKSIQLRLELFNKMQNDLTGMLMNHIEIYK